MAATIPTWLSQHGGSLREGSDRHSWFVYFAGEPQYRLKPIPAAGRFGCEVEQTVNSRRLDGPDTFSTSDEALQGGLEVLRQKLGW
jgi:hypothetical protein